MSSTGCNARQHTDGQRLAGGPPLRKKAVTVTAFRRRWRPRGCAASRRPRPRRVARRFSWLALAAAGELAARASTRRRSTCRGRARSRPTRRYSGRSQPRAWASSWSASWRRRAPPWACPPRPQLRITSTSCAPASGRRRGRRRRTPPPSSRRAASAWRGRRTVLADSHPQRRAEVDRLRRDGQHRRAHQ